MNVTLMTPFGMSHFDDASTAVTLPLSPRIRAHPLPKRDTLFVKRFPAPCAPGCFAETPRQSAFTYQFNPASMSPISICSSSPPWKQTKMKPLQALHKMLSSHVDPKLPSGRRGKHNATANTPQMTDPRCCCTGTYS